MLEFLDQMWTTQHRAGPVSAIRRDAVRRAVIAVRPKAARKVLDQVLRVAVPGPDPQLEVLTALAQYGMRLQHEAEYKLAAHVYGIVIDYANHAGFLELAGRIYEHLGTCQRECGDVQAAEQSYGAGITLAERCRDEPTRLRIAIARGNLHRSCGERLQARAILEPVLFRARTLDKAELVTRAAHELGNVAHALGEFELALTFYVEAFGTCTDSKERSRLLNDIALSLSEGLGSRDEARAIWLFVFQSPKGEKYARWAAGINLMMLAHVRGEETTFDQLRQELEPAPMSARLLVNFWLEVGDGSTRFGRPEAATMAYARAAELAERSEWGGELERAKRALAGIPLPMPPAATDGSLPAGVVGVLDTLRALRSQPGLAEATPLAKRRTSLRRGRPRRSDLA